MSRLSDERIMELAEISPIWYAIPQGREKYLLTAFARRIEREAYKAGQEAMRERTATLTDQIGFDWKINGDMQKVYATEYLSVCFRNLEIEEPK
jgi:hypothetical protein